MPTKTTPSALSATERRLRAMSLRYLPTAQSAAALPLFSLPGTELLSLSPEQRLILVSSCCLLAVENAPITSLPITSLRRLGSACNEVGVLFMDRGAFSAAAIQLSRARAALHVAGDSTNECLALCNLGRLCKLAAVGGAASPAETAARWDAAYSLYETADRTAATCKEATCTTHFISAMRVERAKAAFSRAFAIHDVHVRAPDAVKEDHVLAALECALNIKTAGFDRLVAAAHARVAAVHHVAAEGAAEKSVARLRRARIAETHYLKALIGGKEPKESFGGKTNDAPIGGKEKNEALIGQEAELQTRMELVRLLELTGRTTDAWRALGESAECARLVESKEEMSARERELLVVAGVKGGILLQNMIKAANGNEERITSLKVRNLLQIGCY